ncbi:MAG: LysM peptidoglycan-binding domain-containing protein [Nostocales cyanobacterium 94392]|nr:LysM peptidoglycan-binding domain-containing protein [Nostocales cyanobacterium 94392]
MSLQKAYFINLDKKERESSYNDESQWKLEVQFNPTDLNFSKNSQFAEIAIPGLDAPVQQFIHGNKETLNLELFFDTTDDGMGLNAKSVTDLTDKFYDLVKQDRETHAPPKCLFVWGPPQYQEIAEFLNSISFSVVSNAPFWFTCIIESIDRKFLLFSSEGIPLRARLTVRLREYQTIEQMASRLNSADHTKAHIIKRRERLDGIAAREYQTPAEWRRIAEANDIDDPRRIRPGTTLVIPPILTESVIQG